MDHSYTIYYTTVEHDEVKKYETVVNSLDELAEFINSAVTKVWIIERIIKR